MTREDYLSINAIRSSELQGVLRSALDGKMTKSQFVDAYILTPSVSMNRKNRRKHHQPKQAMYHADVIERYFGWVWCE